MISVRDNSLYNHFLLLIIIFKNHCIMTKKMPIKSFVFSPFNIKNGCKSTMASLQQVVASFIPQKIGNWKKGVCCKYSR